jgi:ABC-type Na+ efflux pump permease subunit
MNVVYVLWLRQLKRFVRARSRILASVGQPLLYLLVLGYGLGPVFERAGMGSYLQFIAPGVIAMTVLFTSIFSGIELIWDRQFGFLKETLVAPVPSVWIMLGRTLGGATVAVFQGVVVLGICFACGFRMDNYLLLPIAFALRRVLAVLPDALRRGGTGERFDALEGRHQANARRVGASKQRDRGVVVRPAGNDHIAIRVGGKILFGSKIAFSFLSAATPSPYPL